MTITVSIPARTIKSVQDEATIAKGSTVAVGSPICILNKSRHDAVTAESLTEPTSMSEITDDVRPLTALNTKNDAVVYDSGSLEVWIYSEIAMTIAVEEL